MKVEEYKKMQQVKDLVHISIWRSPRDELAEMMKVGADSEVVRKVDYHLDVDIFGRLNSTDILESIRAFISQKLLDYVL